MRKSLLIGLVIFSSSLFAQNENKIGTCLYQYNRPGDNTFFRPTGRKEIKFDANNSNKKESCMKCTEYFLNLPLKDRTLVFSAIPVDVKTLKINELNLYDVKVVVTMSKNSNEKAFCSHFMDNLKGHSVKLKLLNEI